MYTTTIEANLAAVCIILLAYMLIFAYWLICLLLFKIFCGLPNNEVLSDVIVMGGLEQRNLPDPNRANIGPQPDDVAQVSSIT